MAKDTFLVSVANAIGLDPVSRAAIFHATANAQSGLTLSMASTDVRGGINNPLRYRYMHDRALEATIQSVVFTKEWLALNVGGTITNGSVRVVQDECLQLKDGVGTISEEAIGDVTVMLGNGAIQVVTPVDKTITVSGKYSGKVRAIYDYNTVADRVVIGTTTPPTIITLILTAEVRDNSRGIVSYFQAEIPSFQIDGNYELTMSADGVSTESLNGTALNVEGETCGEDDIYAYTTWIPAADVEIAISDIAATPSVITAPVGETLSQQIVVYGVRGGLAQNLVLTDGVEFSMDTYAGVTVSETGLVTIADTAEAGSATIDVAYKEKYKDEVTVTITATP